MADRDTARLFGIVEEIALSVHIGMVADDLDGVFVRANGTIGTQAVEHALERSFARRIDLFLDLQGQARHIVGNTDGKAFLRLCRRQVFIDGVDHRRREFLAAHAVTAADAYNIQFGIEQSSLHILQQRFACAARLFGTIHNRNAFDGLG